ncbi:MAG TPA: aminotransferase class V-fold PLP-dependent enzyme [Planctomycetota bacterium]|jgi:selenocysteine lyase/cysteine desulfurase|nr:aminotransferase class V-fold PLP-dependent enzyme [Planctomycetota bacterium]
MNRRQALGSIYVPALAWTVGCRAEPRSDALERVAGLTSVQGTPAAIAADEDFWMTIQEAFTPDRSMVNLNNGGVCPSPAPVQAAMKRYLDHANTAPAYVLWKLQEPQKETVRTGLAALFGCDRDEIAITRNASESLENVQQGLELARGDEVLTTNQDYPRMITTWKQRERRNGIVLKQVPIPVPCEDPLEIVRRFEAGVTAKTRVIHMCHVINLTGQILPVRLVVQMARAKGIPVIVDGAHSFAHLDFKHADLDCDYYGTSLHKFLFAPHGTGMLFVRKSKIPELWPLMPAPPEMDADIRKFEEIGTHPAANFLAIADALTFHAGIGPARKEARLLYLRDRWAKRLAGQERFRLHTSLKPGFATGVANVEIDGIDAGKLSDHLWEKDRIFTVAIKHENFQGIRVSPAVYTTLAEVDRFGDAMERVAKNGLPA